MDVEDLARRVEVDPETVARWESGDLLPSRGEFTRLVGVLQRPSAIFFLPEPPEGRGLKADLRRAPGLAGHKLSPDEILHIRRARWVQDVVSWILRDEDAGEARLPHVATTQSAAVAAAAFRERLGIPVETQTKWSTAYKALRAWRDALQDVGVLVLQVELGRERIRGFSIWDDRAPLVAVNSAYSPTARIFTLFHEVGHLLTRTESACMGFVAPGREGAQIERWCERFAAELLVPADALRTVAGSFGATSRTPVDDVETARKIAGRFKVSTRAVALRLQEVKLAPPTLYSTVDAELSAYDWNPRQEKGGGGRPAVEKRLAEFGDRIPSLLLRAADDGRLTVTDLAGYLDLNTRQLADLRELVGAHD